MTTIRGVRDKMEKQTSAVGNPGVGWGGGVVGVVDLKGGGNERFHKKKPKVVTKTCLPGPT